jgi:hypothetical protein
MSIYYLDWFSSNKKMLSIYEEPKMDYYSHQAGGLGAEVQIIAF